MRSSVQVLLSWLESRRSEPSWPANTHLTPTPSLYRGALQASSKSTDFTWDTKNVLGLGLGAVIGALTGPGGGGGATFYYPLFSSYLGISMRETAELVSFVMLMGAISSFGLALFQRHPTNPSRALIDYASVLVLSPPMLFGVKVGRYRSPCPPAPLASQPCVRTLHMRASSTPSALPLARHVLFRPLSASLLCKRFCACPGSRVRTAGHRPTAAARRPCGVLLAAQARSPTRCCPSGRWTPRRCLCSAGRLARRCCRTCA